MRHGIYISPTVVRLGALGLLALILAALRTEGPALRRYWKFETM
jgi:hypothetical protein